MAMSNHHWYFGSHRSDFHHFGAHGRQHLVDRSSLRYVLQQTLHFNYQIRSSGECQDLNVNIHSHFGY